MWEGCLSCRAAPTFSPLSKHATTVHNLATRVPYYWNDKHVSLLNQSTGILTGSATNVILWQPCFFYGNRRRKGLIISQRKQIITQLTMASRWQHWISVDELTMPHQCLNSISMVDPYKCKRSKQLVLDRWLRLFTFWSRSDVIMYAHTHTHICTHSCMAHPRAHTLLNTSITKYHINNMTVKCEIVTLVILYKCH